MTETDGENMAPAESNETKLKERLEDGSLAKRLAVEYDAAKSPEDNRDALKKVVEAELDKVRRALGENKNQVD